MQHVTLTSEEAPPKRLRPAGKNGKRVEESVWTKFRLLSTGHTLAGEEYGACSSGGSPIMNEGVLGEFRSEICHGKFEAPELAGRMVLLHGACRG